MSLDKQQDMAATLEAVGKEYGLSFTPEEVKSSRYSKRSAFQ